MGLVKTRRLAAMHPPSRDALRRTGKMQRAKLGKGKPFMPEARPLHFGKTGLTSFPKMGICSAAGILGTDPRDVLFFAADWREVSDTPRQFRGGFAAPVSLLYSFCPP